MIYCRLIVKDNLQKRPQREIRPHFFHEGIVALVGLIQQKVAQSHLIRCPNQHVRLHIVPTQQQLFKFNLILRVLLKSFLDLISRVIANADIQYTLLIITCQLFRTP